MELNANTKLLGLFANPASHSLSPIMHNESFKKMNINYIYLAFEVDKNNLKDAVISIKTLGMIGVNLSMPNKQEVIKYIDKLSDAAELTGSVNTIVNKEGILTGYNTDGSGYIESLKKENIDILGKKITVLGTGGAALSIIAEAALKGVKEIAVFKKDTIWENVKKTIEKIAGKTGCIINLYTLEDKNRLKKEIEESEVLTNATSVGMKENISLIEDKSFFRKSLIVYDCIYSPRKTRLLEIAEKSECKILNGIGMLMYQGAEAFKLWTDKEMPVEYIRNMLFGK